MAPMPAVIRIAQTLGITTSAFIAGIHYAIRNQRR